MFDSSFCFRAATLVYHIYQHIDTLTIKNIFKHKVLKFVFSFKTKTIPECFSNYFQPIVQIYNYPTKYAPTNLAVFKFNKISTQRSIQYSESKF